VRSLTGADELLARGFQDVASLNGGILAWAAAGYPVEQ
jgi:rhodanese-related sulfurtransferase